jgi:hypothetical protein
VALTINPTYSPPGSFQVNLRFVVVIDSSSTANVTVAGFKYLEIGIWELYVSLLFLDLTEKL